MEDRKVDELRRWITDIFRTALFLPEQLFRHFAAVAIRSSLNLDIATARERTKYNQLPMFVSYLSYLQGLAQLLPVEWYTLALWIIHIYPYETSTAGPYASKFGENCESQSRFEDALKQSLAIYYRISLQVSTVDKLEAMHGTRRCEFVLDQLQRLAAGQEKALSDPVCPLLWRLRIVRSVSSQILRPQRKRA